MPKTIKIFLVDGKPSGLRILNISNWDGRGAIVPRNSLKQFFQREDFKRPSIYFLFGASPEASGLYRVYIGEAENLQERLVNHDYEKEFWQSAFVFTGDHMTKAHIGYLESKCINLAKNLKRCILENKKDSLENFLSESDRAEADEYLEHVIMLMGALGYPILSSSLEPAKENDSILTCTKGVDIEAKGMLTDDGLEVLEGSYATTEATPSFPEASKKLREFLVAEGVLVQENNRYRFTKNYTFSSPSSASDIITGNSSNGRTKWKNASGKTIAESEALGSSQRP